MVFVVLVVVSLLSVDLSQQYNDTTFVIVPLSPEYRSKMGKTCGLRCLAPE